MSKPIYMVVCTVDYDDYETDSTTTPIKAWSFLEDANRHAAELAEANAAKAKRREDYMIAYSDANRKYHEANPDVVNPEERPRFDHVAYGAHDATEKRKYQKAHEAKVHAWTARDMVFRDQNLAISRAAAEFAKAAVIEQGFEPGEDDRWDYTDPAHTKFEVVEYLLD